MFDTCIHTPAKEFLFVNVRWYFNTSALPVLIFESTFLVES